MLDIYTDMDWVLWIEHLFMEMKNIHLQRAELKDTPKIKVKKLCSKLVHFAEISLQQLKMVL